MSQKNNKNTVTGVRQKAEELIYTYMNVASALFWRIDIIGHKIKYFNNYMVPGLGAETGLLLKDMEYSRKVILEDDFPGFQAFMDAVKRQKSASVLVRVKTQNSTLKWLRISGYPDPCRTACCFGSISEDTELINGMLACKSGASSIKNRLNLFDTPVFLARFSDRKIVAANKAALACFHYTVDDISLLGLEDLFSVAGHPQLHGIYESLIFEHKWNGNILLECKNKTHFSGQAAIRAICDSGENLLWISIRNLKKEQFLEDHPGGQDKTSCKKTVLRKIGRTKNLQELLSVILENQPLPNLADALLCSRVDIPQNRVSVYGSGSGFDGLTPGSTHPYVGSVAENILNFKLSHLIVKETSESIKPIDWALFIPMGVRSYYAKPFYENNTLHTVLIFCSSKSDMFDEENILPYQALLPAFLKGLEKFKN